MVKRLSIFMFLCIPLVFGQLDSNSVTVTATRSTAQQPDQVLFEVIVQSSINTGLDSVVAALQGSGITAANLSGVGSGPQLIPVISPAPQPLPTTITPMIEWAFTLPVPLVKIKDTASTLSALQKSIAQQSNGLTLSFNVQGAQVSTQSQQSQVCPIPDLLTDATAQAQKLAAAAGLSLGVVLAMSSAASVPAGGISATPVFASLGFVSTTYSTFPSICSMTVKFGLLRY